MSEFDLTPPALPGQKKSGFLKKFFFKEEPETKPVATQPPTPLPPPQEPVDLEEIKRKLGLDDELPPPKPVQQPKPEQPKIEVKIDDWASEAQQSTEWEVPRSASSWTAAPEPKITKEEMLADQLEPIQQDHALEVHAAIEKQLAPIDAQQLEIEATIKAAAERPNLPEWKLQEKEVTPEQYFILKNGQPVKSLRELIDILDYIDDTTFEHHVNEYRNDFSNWIRDVIGDADLADKVQAAENRGSMLRALINHEKGIAKKAEKENTELQKVMQKRQAVVRKLEGVEDRIDLLRKQLEQKTKELAGERKRNAKLVKDKLDAEVKRRLGAQQAAYIAAKSELAKARNEYIAKTQEYEHHIKTLGEREKRVLLAEQRTKQATDEMREERKILAQEKHEAQQLLKDAAQLKKQWEDMKRLDAQVKQNLQEISKREIEISRREETLRQREKKVSADLTKIHEEQDRLKELKGEHDKREAAAKELEAEANKAAEEAEERAKEALDAERTSRERIKQEQKKLEMLRKQIEQSLAKALKNKQKITTAVALRKHLEESMNIARNEVVKEREQMEQEAYKSYMENKTLTTPIGQPDISHTEDIQEMPKTQLPIYQKVEECRQALERRDLQTAKRLYNELRAEFQAAKLASPEKNALYASIRELYDDIHLAMLG
jgi:hypothetical protein